MYSNHASGVCVVKSLLTRYKDESAENQIYINLIKQNLENII
jgi:hypothetical protein